MDSYISGGISGAITDPMSDVAIKHAELYYNEIRSFATDIVKISQNTGYSFLQIQLIKNYLFYDLHVLDGEIKRFDPCFEIAESWRRLAFDPKNIQSHDLTLLKHELNEISLVASGLSQEQAHNKTNVLYNYTRESNDYYEKISLIDKKENINYNNDDFNR